VAWPDSLSAGPDNPALSCPPNRGHSNTSNLQAACGPCNYGGGAQIAASNKRATRTQIAQLEQRNWHLEQAVDHLERRCEELALAFAAATNNATTHEPTGKQPRPAIH